MAEGGLSEESLIAARVQPPSDIKAEMPAPEARRDKYCGELIPKAAEVEFPHPKARKKGEPLSELGGVEWGLDWKQARLPKPLGSSRDQPKERRRAVDPFEVGRSRQERSPSPAPIRSRLQPASFPRSRQATQGRQTPLSLQTNAEEEGQLHQVQAYRGQQGERGAVLNELPQFRGKFDGDSDQLALFLDSAEIHLECYGHLYPSPRAMVNTIAEGLEGEAREWLAALHKRRAPQLQDVDDFLRLLEARFEEAEEDLYAEDELSYLKQRGRPIKEHIREFRRVIGRLPPLPEQLLVHFFRTSLDSQIAQITAYLDVPNQLSEWFRVAIKVDSGLRTNNRREQPDIKERGQPDLKPPS